LFVTNWDYGYGENDYTENFGYGAFSEKCENIGIEVYDYYMNRDTFCSNPYIDDPIQYWEASQTINLKHLALKILRIVPHTGPLECFHSTLAFQKSEYRLNMGIDTMKKMAKLQRYLQPEMAKRKKSIRNHNHHPISSQESSNTSFDFEAECDSDDENRYDEETAVLEPTELSVLYAEDSEPFQVDIDAEYNQTEDEFNFVTEIAIESSTAKEIPSVPAISTVPVYSGRQIHMLFDINLNVFVEIRQVKIDVQPSSIPTTFKLDDCMKSIEERISNSTMTANSDSMLPNKRSSITDLEILTSSEIHSPALKKTKSTSIKSFYSSKQLISNLKSSNIVQKNTFESLYNDSEILSVEFKPTSKQFLNWRDNLCALQTIMSMFYIYLIRSTDPLHVYQFQRDFPKLYAIFKFFCDQKIDCNVALDEIEKLYYDYPGSEFVRKGRKNDYFSLGKVLKHLTENLATNKKRPFYGFTIIISLGPGEQYSERYNVLEVFYCDQNSLQDRLEDVVNKNKWTRFEEPPPLLIIALNDTNLGKKSCTFVVNEAFTILGHVYYPIAIGYGNGDHFVTKAIWDKNILHYDGMDEGHSFIIDEGQTQFPCNTGKGKLKFVNTIFAKPL